MKTNQGFAAVRDQPGLLDPDKRRWHQGHAWGNSEGDWGDDFDKPEKTDIDR